MTPGEFSKLWNRYRTTREVAEAAGMCCSRAHGLARAMGLPAKRRTRARSQRDLELIEQVRTLREDGKTFRQIAAIVGKGLCFVHRHGRDA